MAPGVTDPRFLQTDFEQAQHLVSRFAGDCNGRGERCAVAPHPCGPLPSEQLDPGTFQGPFESEDCRQQKIYLASLDLLNASKV
jgi:hypothetical protein